MRGTPRQQHDAEKETVGRAAGKVKRERIAGAPRRRGPGRSEAAAALDRARQALLGMILNDGASAGEARDPADGKIGKERLEAMSDETVQKMSAFFSAARAGGKIAADKPALQSLEAELVKRGISLQLSGKVNNVYLSGEHASWTVNASAGGDGEPDKKAKDDRSGTRSSRCNNFGHTVGRFAKNFILGH